MCHHGDGLPHDGRTSTVRTCLDCLAKVPDPAQVVGPAALADVRVVSFSWYVQAQKNAWPFGDGTRRKVGIVSGSYYLDAPRAQRVVAWREINWDDQIGRLGAKLERAERDAQVELVASVACDPQLIQTLERIAGGMSVFAEAEDLRLIYWAVQTACDRHEGPALALRRAVIWLRHKGYWDTGAPARTRGPRWSWASLTALFGDYPRGGSAIDRNLRELVTIQRDQRERRQALRRVLAPLQRTRCVRSSKQPRFSRRGGRS